MNELSISMDFESGWLTLGIVSPAQSVRIKTPGMTDSVSRLADCVNGVRQLGSATSCQMEAEPGGWFLDFTHRPGETIAFSVQKFRYISCPKEASRRHDALPVRGDLLFAKAVQYDELADAFSTAYRRAEHLYAEADGSIKSWGWPFPGRAVERMRTRAHP